MTIDERLEALVQSAEILLLDSQQHSLQIAEHTRQLAQDAQHIRALARIAEAHIADLEEHR